eukprot:CAMPEP_0174285478 /NCGR_PEP_ID=MMETSP0809-20121228/8892_1 /TAXON_ID=73025 ORGANISM="Eutreptiella gymnastica-like, Strain CCMP1594" /NCGR_SAMPLE_ID=MMETSP0809 /ASSEMBLY_ACC=CAM_ASM_000658 /LENGTH=474 /DNA_ID=CAMNT_0015381273 /DNA_START=39 /DNA_END=1463 /DNA_ORIENTATION=+
MAFLAPSEGHKLAHDWTFWTSSMRGTPEVTRHEQFDTIEAFWRLMAKHKFSELRDRSCLHVFKDDIRPLWEDPKNHCGGHFKLTASNQNTTETMWLEVVLNLLGQQFPYRDLVNGASIMANKTGNHLVKIWIAVVKKPVVQALRDFIRAALKDADYFEDDVRLVPHKLVVKGAGKKIPGVPKDSDDVSDKPAPSMVSVGNIPMAPSLPPSLPQQSSDPASRCHSSNDHGMYAQLLLSAPTVGGPISAPAPDISGPSAPPSPPSEVSVDIVSGGALSSVPSPPCSDIGLCSAPHTPRSLYDAELEGWRVGAGGRRSSSCPERCGHSVTAHSNVASGYSTPVSPRSVGSAETATSPTRYVHSPYTFQSHDGVGREAALTAGYSPQGTHLPAVPNGMQVGTPCPSAPALQAKEHRRRWSTETYAIWMDPYHASRADSVAEWQDSPAVAPEFSWNPEMSSYRHEPYSLSASIVPVLHY